MDTDHDNVRLQQFQRTSRGHVFPHSLMKDIWVGTWGTEIHKEIARCYVGIWVEVSPLS